MIFESCSKIEGDKKVTLKCHSELARNPECLIIANILNSSLHKLILLLAIFLMALPNCFSQQFTYPWSFKDSTGAILDMHLMPGDSEFIYTTKGNLIRIRSTETGELKREYPSLPGKFGFTADSQKIFLVYYNRIEIRNLSDMQLVASDTILLGADSLDPQWHSKLALVVSNFAMDPVKPFAYFIIEKFNNLPNPYQVDSFLVVSYNYESMKLMNNFVSKTRAENYVNPVLAVSSDGKYLAALNNYAARLKVWDLPTLKLVRDFPLYDTVNYNQKPDSYNCTITQLTFSDINTDNIYFSGNFPKNRWAFSGLGIYNINSNSITDTTFCRLLPGTFVLFDNEQRMVYRNDDVNVLNLNTKTIEYQVSIPFGEIGTWVFMEYSKKNNFFIGQADKFCSKGIYDSGTWMDDKNIKHRVLYPNPTSTAVTIETDCSAPTIDYTISKPNGDLILSSTAEITDNKTNIDFSSYSNGVYFLTLTCGNSKTTYKVVKEG